MSEEVKNNPVIRISVVGAVGDKCQMSFETYADASSSVEFLNALTDKLMHVRDRQAAKYEIVDLEKLLATETVQLAAIKDDLTRVDKMHASKAQEAANKGMRVGRTLSKQEEAERHNIVANIVMREKRLVTLKEDIEKRKALVGEVN